MLHTSNLNHHINKENSVWQNNTANFNSKRIGSRNYLLDVRVQNNATQHFKNATYMSSDVENSHHPITSINVFDEMENRKEAPSEESYKAFFETIEVNFKALNSHDKDSCIRILNQAIDNKVSIPDKILGIAINLCVNFNDHNGANLLFEKSKSIETKPNIVIYNSILSMHINKNDQANAAKIIDEIIEKKIPFSKYTFAILLSYYKKFKGHEELKEFWKVVKNTPIKQDYILYSSLIDQFSQANDLEAMNDVMAEIRLRKIRCSEITQQFFINYYIKNKEIENALIWFKKIEHLHEPVYRNSLYTLNCHNQSHGSACAMISNFLNLHTGCKSFDLITGIGNSSNRNIKFEMRDRVIQYITEFHPEFKWAPTNNPGVIQILSIEL